MRTTRLLALLALLAPALAARAEVSEVRLMPPSGARFLPGQRFDVRVEGRSLSSSPAYAASLTVDGRPVAFTSAADPVTTDGITAKGYGGFDVRAFTLRRPGKHVLSATFTDGAGAPVTVTSEIEVVRIGSGQGVKNVIIFLGDGMGAAHRTAARIVSKGVTAGDPDGWLHMDGMPGTGLVSTSSLNSIVTDSAPGMACYSTGNHAQNGQEGVFPAQVTSPFLAPRVEYLGAYLHRTQGKALGIVSTADLEDATPAANAVYTANRGAGTGIVDQYLDESDAGDSGQFGSGLRVLLGGGRRWFVPSNAANPYSSRATGSDYGPLPADLVAGWGLPAAAAGKVDVERDLVGDFQAAGFTYAADKAGLDAALAGRPRRLLGLFAWGNMNVALDKIDARRARAGVAGASDQVVQDHQAPDQPMLDELTSAALTVLDRSRRGFVLMVEGAHIDKQSHNMDAERAIGDVIELDRAIGVGLEYARREGNTLVLVTADHECSGFSLIGALSGQSVAQLRGLPSDAAALDPAVAPLRQAAVGTYDSARFPRYSAQGDGYPASYDVDGKLLVGFGAGGDRFESWLTPGRPSRESLTPSRLASELGAKGYASSPVARADKAGGFFIRGQAVGREQAVHTATDVPLSAYARNPFAWLPFVGVQRNTDVFFKNRAGGRGRLAGCATGCAPPRPAVAGRTCFSAGRCMQSRRRGCATRPPRYPCQQRLSSGPPLPAADRPRVDSAGEGRPWLVQRRARPRGPGPRARRLPAPIGGGRSASRSGCAWTTPPRAGGPSTTRPT
ncbi:MAG: alkaline phosphatase [Anaeromyxobacter sp.]